ncbi:MAG: hypothetical protein WB992_04830 [Bryobacteraceae bacterium]
MKKAKRKPDPARAAFDEYPRMRIRWIDRLTSAINETPGAPVATPVARSCVRLLAELESYRDGFVHALNHMEQKERRRG